MKEPISLTRDELHDLVWSVPVAKLGPRYGISDVGLAKICERHRIPRPPRGYWAKQRAGKRVSRTALPPLTLGERDLRTITLSPNVHREKTGPVPTAEADPHREEQLVVQVVVADELTNPHPLLRTGRDQRGKAKHKTPRQALRESLCRKCYGRALRILDGLFKALEEQRFGVSCSQASIPQFIISVYEQRVAFQITEEKESVARRRWIPPERRHSLFDDSYETHYEEVCTRRLRIETENLGRSETQHFWVDTEKRALEDHLDNVFRGLIKIAEAKRALLKQWEEQQRRWEEEEKERKQKEGERKKRETLKALVANRQEAEEIRGFVRLMRYRHSGTEGEHDGALEELLTWAEGYAESIDPLGSPVPLSIVEDTREEPSSPRYLPYINRMHPR